MSKQAIVDIDMNLNQLINLIFHLSATDITSGITGQVFFNTTEGKLKIHNWAAFKEILTEIQWAILTAKDTELEWRINDLNTILQSDDTTLDELQELVNFIKINKETLDTLSVSNIAWLETYLESQNIELQKNSTHIQWRRVSGTWADLVPLMDLIWPQWEKVQLRANGMDLEYKYETEVLWTFLFDLSSLIGADGRDPQFVVTGGILKYRLTGDVSWIDLYTFPSNAVSWTEVTDKPALYTSSEVDTFLWAKINTSDIKNDLTSSDVNKPLSAYQWMLLKTLIDWVVTILASDDTTLDEIQELVNYIKQNRSDLDALGISNIAWLTDALALKSNTNHNHDLLYQIIETVNQVYAKEIRCRAASTTNIASLSGFLTVDSITLADGDYFLNKNATTASLNWVWIVRAWAWERAPEYNTTDDFNTKCIFVTSGTTNTATWWQCSTKNVVVGTTSVTMQALTYYTDPTSLSKLRLTTSVGIEGIMRYRYTNRTVTATSGATDLVVNFTWSTASQVETMPSWIALTNNTGRVIFYKNNSTVPWIIRQSASNTVDGDSSDITILPGENLMFQNIALNTWISIQKSWVNLTNDQTIDWVKTFSVSPIIPTTPSSGWAAVNKDYVASLLSDTVVLSWVAWETISKWNALCIPIITGTWNISQATTWSYLSYVQNLWETMILPAWSEITQISVTLLYSSWWWFVPRCNIYDSVWGTLLWSKSATTQYSSWNAARVFIFDTPIVTTTWSFYVLVDVASGAGSFLAYPSNTDLYPDGIFYNAWTPYPTRDLPFSLDYNIPNTAWKIFKTDTSKTDRRTFIWLAEDDYILDDTISYRDTWISNTQTWLTIWDLMYLSTVTAWLLTTTPNTYKSVGMAVSSTEIEVNPIWLLKYFWTVQSVSIVSGTGAAGTFISSVIYSDFSSIAEVYLNNSGVGWWSYISLQYSIDGVTFADIYNHAIVWVMQVSKFLAKKWYYRLYYYRNYSWGTSVTSYFNINT